MPSVSVVMPCYNRADLVGESIESMLGQSLPPHEIIVVDDGSIDGSVRILRGFGDRIRVIEQANAGPGAARNAGLALATGEFVQFFDSDDVCSRDKLERQAEALARTGADVAYSAWLPAWLQDGKARFDGLVRQTGPVGLAPLSAFMRGWIILLPCCLIRRSLLSRLGGYPTARRTGEDLELLFRMIVARARFEYVAGPIVLVRQHPSGQISAAPEHAAMRVADRVHLTRTVWELLAGSDHRAGLFDRHLWRAEMERAEHEHSGARLGPVWALTRSARKIAAGLRARIRGTRLPGFWRSAPMTAAQAKAVRAIGYEPVRF